MEFVKRYLKLGAIYFLVMFPFAFMVIVSENQLPWFLMLMALFLAFGVFGNLYIFFPDRWGSLISRIKGFKKAP